MQKGVITDIQDGIYDLKVGFSMILPPIFLCIFNMQDGIYDLKVSFSMILPPILLYVSNK